jgi:ABC-2 type transport system permease protein
LRSRSAVDTPATLRARPATSTALRWLLAKEWRELLASRAWWVMLFVIGPLVGVSFISAVRVYGELSGLNGASAGVGEAFSPLVGVWAPTFSACELAAVFLLPFVGIRLVGGDRQSGALKLELQHPLPAVARIGAKAVVLLAAWLLATLAPIVGIALWRSYGGAVHGPELFSLLIGHFLNAGLTVAAAAAMAALSEHPSTAAILTLTLTVGTWIVDFMGAVHGGLWQQAAAYVPAAMVGEFQHGLIRLDQALISLTVITLGLLVASIWIRSGVRVRRRALESTAVAVAALLVIVVFAQIHASWDVSENRMNSFPRSDEAALARIHDPLSIEVHLAPEDPRRVDLERGVVSKLTRVLPNTRVAYVSQSSTGLFEQAREHYGEIWYELRGRRVMNRATTPEAVLETVYQLAGVAPERERDHEFRGRPLAVTPRGASVAFYLAWPGVVLALMVLCRRQR